MIVGGERGYAFARADDIVGGWACFGALTIDASLAFGTGNAAFAAVIGIRGEECAGMAADNLALNVARTRALGIDAYFAIFASGAAGAAVERVRENIGALIAAAREMFAAFNDAFAIEACCIFGANGIAVAAMVIIAIDVDTVGTAADFVFGTGS